MTASQRVDRERLRRPRPGCGGRPTSPRRSRPSWWTASSAESTRPGTPLPPEPALCETFSVSRTVVREAVKMLQEKGLVQVRQGAGTMVTPPTMWNMLDELVLGGDHRRGRQPGHPRRPRRHPARCWSPTWPTSPPGSPTPRRVDRLRALVDRMDELVDDHVTYHEHDRAFHDTIMQASGNRIARAVVRALESQVVNTARYMGQHRARPVRGVQPRPPAHLRAHRRPRPRRRRRGDVHPHHRGLAGPPQRAGRAGPAAALTPAHSRGAGFGRLLNRGAAAGAAITGRVGMPVRRPGPDAV